MSVIGEAKKFVDENSQVKLTNYYRDRIIKHVHATTGILITKEEAVIVLNELIKQREAKKV